MEGEQERDADADDKAELAPETELRLDQGVGSDRPEPKHQSVQSIESRPQEQLKA
jgi:hypothetical protein